jgi:hypothetical protein
MRMNAVIQQMAMSLGGTINYLDGSRVAGSRSCRVGVLETPRLEITSGQ